MYGSELAEVYDLIYRGQKDYAAEARAVAELIRAHNPAATSVLDVACGTGEHLAYLRSYFHDVAGVEVSAAMLAHLSQESHQDGDRLLVRMAHSGTDGRRSRIRMHYLLGDASGIRHFEDQHDLTLFTHEEYERALTLAGGRVTFRTGGPTGRGLYLAAVPNS